MIFKRIPFMRACAAVFCAALSLGLLGACDKKPETAGHATSAQGGSEAAAPTSSAALDDEKILNIYNWPDYVAASLIPDFEKETGIKVHYRTYENNELLQAKLVAGNTGFDIVVPGTLFVHSQIKAGFYQPIDKTALAHYANLDPQLLAKLRDVDPGNAMTVPWAWGFTTVGINRDKVERALGGMAMPDNAWDLVLNPKYTQQLKACGIAYLDTPTEIIPAALHYLGKPAYSNNPADHKLAGEALAKVRKDLRLFTNNMVDDVASGKVCAAIGYSIDFNLAAQHAAENNSRERIEALLPSTGGLIFMDVMAIPKEAKHPKNAYAFIDFYLRKEQSAKQMNEMLYMTANAAARNLMDPAIASNKSINVQPEDLAKMVQPSSLSNEGRESMSTVYTAFKKGK